MTEEQRDAVVNRAWNTLLELGGVSYAIVEARVHGQEVVSVHGVADGRRTRKRIREDDAGGRALSGRLALEVREERLMAKIIAGIGTSHTPAHRRRRRQRQDGRAVLDAVVQGLRAREEVDGRNQARRRDRRLQRSRQRVRLQNHSDLRARLRGRVPDRRRRLGRAARARRQGLSRARGAHGAVARARRVRHDDRQRDAGRSRPHGAADAAVRSAARRGPCA